MMLKSIQRRPRVGRQWGVGSFWNAANILFHMWVVARTMGSLYENTLSHVSMIHILFNVLVILQKLMLKECYLSIYITFSFFLKLHVSLYKKMSAHLINQKRRHTPFSLNLHFYENYITKIFWIFTTLNCEIQAFFMLIFHLYFFCKLLTPSLNVLPLISIVVLLLFEGSSCSKGINGLQCVYHYELYVTLRRLFTVLNFTFS